MHKGSFVSPYYVIVTQIFCIRQSTAVSFGNNQTALDHQAMQLSARGISYVCCMLACRCIWGTCLHHESGAQPSCIKMGSVFAVGDDKKNKERKGTESHKLVIFHVIVEKRILTKFCASRDMSDIIICAKFGVCKLWYLPLKRLVTLTAVHRAACDCNKSEVETLHVDTVW